MKSSVIIHPQQSTAHLVNLGTNQHKAVNSSGSSSASPHPSAYKSLLAGSWEAAANDSFAAECRKSPFNPACCCLSPGAVTKGQMQTTCQPSGGSGQNAAGNLPWSHTGETSPSKTPFGFGCFPVPVFRQFGASPQSSLIHPEEAGKHPKDFNRVCCCCCIEEIPPSTFLASSPYLRHGTKRAFMI